MERNMLHSEILKRTLAAVVEEIFALCRESSAYLDSTLTEAAQCYTRVAEALGLESGAGGLTEEAAQDLLKNRYISEVEGRLIGVPSIRASRDSILQHAENTLELVDLSFAALLPAETVKVIIRHIAVCNAVRDIAWTKMNQEMDEKAAEVE